MIQYVFPHCKKCEEEIKMIKGINRLFAYPKIPHFENDSNIIILDSGAFGLSCQGKNMNIAYMKKLSAYYNEHHKENVLCIAPDVFQDPITTVRNIKIWNKSGLFRKITPVLQNSKEYAINLSEIKFQIDAYADMGYKTICFSVNKGNAEIYGNQNIGKVFEYIKERGFNHIHLLGAGWNLEDITGWLRIGRYDTMDSIAYYTTKDIKEFGSLNPIQNIKNITEAVKRGQ